MHEILKQYEKAEKIAPSINRASQAWCLYQAGSSQLLFSLLAQEEKQIQDRVIGGNNLNTTMCTQKIKPTAH